MARPFAAPRRLSTTELEDDYLDLLQTLSDGSVRRHFDPYLDIDWDSPEFVIDPNDPRMVLSEHHDPLGAHPWYRALPLERQIEIGLWRQTNVMKVGLIFESILIRGMMQFVMALPNGSPEFRYCLHEMTEECNHIQMFQELVNRSGVDAPGMKAFYRITSPLWGVIVGYFPVLFFIGVLAGEEPIDHFQKNILREGKDRPAAAVRVMAIHIAEEARHISFAHRFLRQHAADQTRFQRAATSIAFPLIMRLLAGVIMGQPRGMSDRLGIPRTVIKEAFWRRPASRAIMRDYFGDVRMLADELGYLNPIASLVWRASGISGKSSRYRGEPDRAVRAG